MEKTIEILCLCLVAGLLLSLVVSFVTDFKVMLLVTIALLGGNFIKTHLLRK